MKSRFFVKLTFVAVGFVGSLSFLTSCGPKGGTPPNLGAPAQPQGAHPEAASQLVKPKGKLNFEDPSLTPYMNLSVTSTIFASVDKKVGIFPAQVNKTIDGKSLPCFFWLKGNFQIHGEDLAIDRKSSEVYTASLNAKDAKFFGDEKSCYDKTTLEEVIGAAFTSTKVQRFDQKVIIFGSKTSGPARGTADIFAAVKHHADITADFLAWNSGTYADGKNSSFTINSSARSFALTLAPRAKDHVCGLKVQAPIKLITASGENAVTGSRGIYLWFDGKALSNVDATCLHQRFAASDLASGTKGLIAFRLDNQNRGIQVNVGDKQIEFTK